MKLLILAAGYAVRLQPLTLNTPKPLLPVGGKKIMDRILDKTAAVKGIDSIYIVSNHKFIRNFVAWRKDSIYRDKISLVDDGSMANETRLGAIRDMALAISEKAISDDLLVIAGDNLFDLNLVKFIDFANRRADGVSVALYDIGDLEAAKKFGVVRVDKSGAVIEFEEKPQSPKSTLVSTGIYYFPKDKVPGILNYVRSEGQKLDAPGYYIKWLSMNDRVYGFSFKEKWCDIGDIASYNKADNEYKERKG